jgi:hypothetical protein
MQILDPASWPFLYVTVPSMFALVTFEGMIRSRRFKESVVLDQPVY